MKVGERCNIAGSLSFKSSEISHKFGAGMTASGDSEISPEFGVGMTEMHSPPRITPLSAVAGLGAARFVHLGVNFGVGTYLNFNVS